MARELRAWAINRGGKNSVRNLRYSPRTQLVRGMSLAVWLGEDRNCFAAVVGSDLASGLSMVRRCSLNRSFKRRLVSPMYCKLQRLH